jgi:uncharacterized protein (UPF0305 family)
MNTELSSLSKHEKIPKDKLLTILREDAKTIGLNDIITSSLFLHHDARFVQANYRKEYLKSYIKGFLTRIRDVK